VAPTSGGKTEAAVLPLASRILEHRCKPISVLYIAPMKALLNDLRERLETLFDPLALRVAVWHGDVSSAKRRGITREPPDVLLATPESIEVLLSFAADERRALIAGVQTVVIDEAHVFFGDDRGTHLLAIIERLAQYADRDLQRIALSATVGNPRDLARWLHGTSRGTMRVCTIPKDPARVERFDVRYTPRLLDILEYFDALRNEKAIVFVPSRRDAETLTAALVARGQTAWAHHSAISATSRRDTEAAIREAPRGLLVATSTFELGIDIGDLDRIVQIDAPATVSAMVQRLGRTGRRAGTEARMTILARKTEPLVLALALLHLHAQGWIEPLEPPAKPFLVLIQQILANLIQTGGMPKALLVSRLAANAAFAKLTHDDVLRFIDALVDSNAIEAVDERLHLAPSTERRFGYRNFGELASLFTSDPVVEVVSHDAVIGSVQRWYLERVASLAEPTFLLGGAPWRVRQWNRHAGTVEVVRAERARAPVYLGGPIELSYVVGMAMKAVLGGLNELQLPPATHVATKAVTALADAQRATAEGCVDGNDNALRRNGKTTRIVTYAGAKINKTIALVLGRSGLSIMSASNISVAFETDRSDDELRHVLASLDEDHVMCALREVDLSTLRVSSKFLDLLTESARRETILATATDAGGALRILQNLTRSQE
jgi:ATP-dependent Lhr-like helicase